MSDVRRLRAVAALAILPAVLPAAVAILPAVLPAAVAAPSSPGGGTNVGPALINALGHPGLCWQAGGNGSAVTLERCDSAVQGQQWSLTDDGVMMNGNGYCLEAKTGGPLFIDFAGQCAGGRGQLWQYRAGQLASAGTGASAGNVACAGPGGPVVPGTEIVRRPCPDRSRWSIGYSAVRMAPAGGRYGGSGPAGGTFGASVTVADAASAQAAYGVAVTFALPPRLAGSGLRVTGTGLRVTGAAPGWTCDVRTLTCTGTLPSGASRRITITGPLPAAARPGDSYTIRARASVTGTSQRRGTSRITTASLPVAVLPATHRPAATRSPLPLAAAAAGALLLAGALLILITRRTRAPAKHSLPR